MKISKEQYYKTMAKALLKGYFRGLEEARKEKKRVYSKGGKV